MAETTSALRKADLHASVSDPVLDTMTFLNDVTMRYPDAVSFAPGRPYDGFFDTEEIFSDIRRYLDYLMDRGHSPEQVRTAMGIGMVDPDEAIADIDGLIDPDDEPLRLD